MFCASVELCGDITLEIVHHRVTEIAQRHRGSVFRQILWGSDPVGGALPSLPLRATNVSFASPTGSGITGQFSGSLQSPHDQCRTNLSP
jgi:hypothetical protein